MLRTFIFTEGNKDELLELHSKVLASVDGTTGLDDKDGVLVAPIIKEDAAGNNYFTVAVGPDTEANLEISVDLDHVDAASFIVQDEENDFPSQKELENMQ